VVNYNVYNRDGMYIANMMQKSGLRKYSEAVCSYFLEHPFNGRNWPEADNPGQILWALHQQWMLTRDRAWAERTYSSAVRIGEMIQYYRTTLGPHWVEIDGLRFGEAVPAEKRQELKPGRCDGFHPEYTEAFDIAGLQGLSEMAEALGRAGEARQWRDLSEKLFAAYDARFGANLAREYGSYSVLWPCRLYPSGDGKAHEVFRHVTPKASGDWRYFPLATAHQGLLAGARDAGWKTVELHLGHEQMQGWYALDEGGLSGTGGWHRTRTKWKHSKTELGENRAVAMPHGWAIAEYWLLVRDCLVFEDEGRLVLLGGVPPEWFRDSRGMSMRGMNTYFGPLSLDYRASGDTASVTIGDEVRPPGGVCVRFPAGMKVEAVSEGKRVDVAPNGDCVMPEGARRLEVRSIS
jgi:hypothetical protein